MQKQSKKYLKTNKKKGNATMTEDNCDTNSPQTMKYADKYFQHLLHISLEDVKTKHFNR